MTDGAITQSAPLSDIFNLATIHSFIGYGKDQYPDETLLSTINCQLEYYLLLDVYQSPPDHHWQVNEAIGHGHDFGAEMDDLFTAALKYGSWTDIRIAVNTVIDMFGNDKPDCILLDDMPYCIIRS